MSHLTQEQRYEIQAYLQQGIKKSEIARLLNRPKKTINQKIMRRNDLSVHLGRQMQGRGVT